METPNLTIEEYRTIIETQREDLRKLTPDGCPYFHAIISETGSGNGAKIAWASHIQIIIGHAWFGNQQPAKQRERPDQVVILSDPSKELHRFTVASTHFFVTDDGVLCCLIPSDDAKALVLLEGDSAKAPSDGMMGDLSFPYTVIRDAVKARNQIWKVTPPIELQKIIQAKWQGKFKPSVTDSTQTIAMAQAIVTASEYFLHTSQEMDALSLAQCEGKTFAGYTMNEQAGAIIHHRTGSPHQIRMELTEDERAAGLALSYLESLARAQDADAVLATAYILGVLAPPPHLPARVALGWIDFDDVLNKIGWIPRNTKDRRALHGKIWNFVKFGERAQIIGKRTGAKYKDAEGNEIDTTIHGAAWRVMKTETPDPPALYAALETPVRAEIVVSKELTALISNPKTAQYFQCGEVLGAIPGGKPAGAWARVIGLALLSFWRRKPREYSAGILKPTRRELLSHYAAKIAPYDEILESNDPSRAIDYWCGALQILADEGFIERTGEAAMSAKEMRAGLPRKNWQALWLDQSINIEVGTKTKPAFEKVLKSQFALKPRDLKKKPRAKKRPKT
jgi:hypothetical protein